MEMSDLSEKEQVKLWLAFAHDKPFWGSSRLWEKGVNALLKIKNYGIVSQYMYDTVKKMDEFASDVRDILPESEYPENCLKLWLKTWDRDEFTETLEHDDILERKCEAFRYVNDTKLINVLLSDNELRDAFYKRVRSEKDIGIDITKNERLMKILTLARIYESKETLKKNHPDKEEGELSQKLGREIVRNAVKRGVTPSKKLRKGIPSNDENNEAVKDIRKLAKGVKEDTLEKRAQDLKRKDQEFGL